MPNMGRVISAHNKKVKEPQGELPPCTCTLYECPVEGTCEKKNIIYQCTVTETTSGKVENYVGLTGNSFKDRLTKHRKSFRDRSYHKNSLSKHIWKLKDKNVDFTVTLKIIDQATQYSQATKICNLCIRECYYIL